MQWRNLWGIRRWVITPARLPRPLSPSSTKWGLRHSRIFTLSPCLSLRQPPPPYHLFFLLFVLILPNKQFEIPKVNLLEERYPWWLMNFGGPFESETLSIFQRHSRICIKNILLVFHSTSKQYMHHITLLTTSITLLTQHWHCTHPHNVRCSQRRKSLSLSQFIRIAFIHFPWIQNFITLQDASTWLHCDSHS